jgi:glutathione S-transferase
MRAHHGKKYDVCGPDEVSISDLANLYADKLDHSVQARSISAAEWVVNNSAVFPQWLAQAVSVNFAEYWGKGLLNYASSPEIIQLCAPRRTIRQWVEENVSAARVGVLGRRSPPVEPAIRILGVPFSSNVMPCAMLALDSGAGELEMMSIDKGENRSPYALSLNPFGQVPILRGLSNSGGDLSHFAVASSNTILRYIAAKFKPEAYGGSSDGNLESKAMIDWALDWSVDFYASFGALWYPVAGVGPQPEKADDEYFKVEREKAIQSLQLFVRKFLSGPSKFIGGETLSIADYKIAIQCWYLGHPAIRNRTGFELPPRLVKYVADFIAACPSASLMDGGRGFMDSKL